MKDWLLAASVYMPMAIIGHAVVDAGWLNAYTAGWAFGGAAVLLRWRVPGLRVRDVGEDEK